MDKYIGKRFDGRYEIRELIGVGGMAYVYKAYDTIDDRIVAVKILKEEFLSNEEFTRRFKNESKAIAILSHPNIVKVFDVSFSSNLQYIVMEYIDGITLKEYLRGQKEMNWKETVHFVTQILRALQHAHDKGIVHRDVKPQNIMLLSDGTIKMTDFGIARFSRSDIRLTQSPEKAIGSVHYISPEQARGDMTDEKADIYSVGVMMYEMLTKTLPFDGDNAVSVAIMQMQTEPKKPGLINPEIPEGLEEITLKAMQKDPDKRYQSAAEMLYDIDEFKRNPSIHFAYKYFVDDTPTRFVDTSPICLTGEPSDEEEDEELVRKGPPVIPILAAVTAAFVIVAVVFLIVVSVVGGGFSNKTEEIIVENFRGKKYEDIIQNESYKGVYRFLKEEAPSDTYEEGVVMNQDLAPNKKVKKQGEVEILLTVSSGEEKIEIPSITSADTAETAKAILKDYYLVPKLVNRSSEIIPEGNVIEIDPKPGVKVAKNSEVTVYVSTGEHKDLTYVPDVIGKHFESAKNSVVSERLAVDGEIEYKNAPVGNPQNAGIIIEQDPPKGTEVEAYTKVKLVASTGFVNVEVEVEVPETATAPIDMLVYINGKYMEELSAENFTYAQHQRHKFTIIENRSPNYDVQVYIKERTSSSETEHAYISYKVNGETGKVTVDQKFPFTPTEVEVPEILSGIDTEESAIQALEEAGLLWEVKEVYSSVIPKGYVISVSPRSGKTIKKTEKVIIYVSDGQ